MTTALIALCLFTLGVLGGAIVLAAAGFYALGYLVAYSRHLTDLMERRALEDARYSAHEEVQR